MTDPTGSALPGRHPAGLDHWRERLVLELRLRNVTGARIGDALAQVDAHCAEARETPLEAFGEPEDYARELADSLSPEPVRATGTWWGYGLLGAAMFSGVLLLLAGFDGVVHGERASVGAGSLVALGLLTLACCAVEPAMRLLSRSRLGLAVFATVFVAVMGQQVLQTAWSDTALSLPAWPSLVAGAVLAVLGLAHVTRVTPDRVVDPRTGREAFTVPRAATLWLTLLLPVLLVVAIGLLVVLPSPR